MKYIVKFLTSRGQKWIKIDETETLEEAFECAKRRWEISIDENAYVSIRIEHRQAK